MENDAFSDEVKAKYQKAQRRKLNKEADTQVFENLLMAYHNLAALHTLKENQGDAYDVCRSAVLAWYYATYFAVSAMVAGSAGSRQI